MSPYIHFTEAQKERAASVDLEEFLRRKGERLITSGRDKRLSSDHSITIRGNEWFDHAISQGGHAISFVQKFYGMNYQDAMLTLLNDEMGMAFPLVKAREPDQPKPFELPEANKDMRRVFAYLVKQRQIDRDVVAHFAKAKTLYEMPNITTQCSLAQMMPALRATPISAAPIVLDKHSASTSRAATLVIVFITRETMGASMCLRLPSICCHS